MDCIIVHGCPDNEEHAMDSKKRTYDKHWVPWITKELEKNGIKTVTPLMPEPWKPNYKAWKMKFDEQNINKNTVLIGHSCGCAFLVRWLGETEKNVKKLILVAPWKIPSGKGEGFETRKRFYSYPINPNVKSQADQIIIFTADDEDEDGKKSAKIFHKVIGGKLIELKGRGHYILGDMGTEKFPELLKEILE